MPDLRRSRGKVYNVNESDSLNGRKAPARRRSSVRNPQPAEESPGLVACILLIGSPNNQQDAPMHRPAPKVTLRALLAAVQVVQRLREKRAQNKETPVEDCTRGPPTRTTSSNVG